MITSQGTMKYVRKDKYIYIICIINIMYNNHLITVHYVLPRVSHQTLACLSTSLMTLSWCT